MDLAHMLPQAIDLSERILQAIDQEDWDAITRLDEQRNRLIEQYFSHSSDIDKALTRQLKQLNDEIVTRLIDLQQINRQQQIFLTRSQKASKAYLDNA